MIQSLARRACARAFPILLAVLAQSALAQRAPAAPAAAAVPKPSIFQCASYAVDVAMSAITKLEVPPGTSLVGSAVGPVITETLALANCKGPTGSLLGISVPFGDKFASSTVPGVSYSAADAPSYVLTGDCPPAKLSRTGTDTVLTVQGSSYSNCGMTLTVKFGFFVGPSRITGMDVISADGPQTGTVGYQGAVIAKCGTTPKCALFGTFNVSSPPALSGNHALPVVVAACSGVLNGNQIVRLPKVSTSTFANPGPVAKTAFQISLANCVGTAKNGVAGNTGYKAHLTWVFSTCTASTVICNGGSSSAQVQILKSDGVTPIDAAQDDIYALTDGTNVFRYFAAYANPAGAPVTPGNVSATATFTVQYE
jgi:type 1 fimbria pilin